jgi:galactokinase
LSGLSSSAAILVAWTKGLDHLLGTALTPIEVGYYAYLAEHNEMGIPCGQMDQLAASVGGVFHMVCTEPPQVEPIEVVGLEGLVVGNTLIPKSTNQVHGVRVAELKGAMEYLKSRMDFDIHTTHFAEVEGLLAAENPIWLKRMRAALMDRDLAQVALGELRQQPVNAVRVGQLLLEHQAYLRDDFEVSVQRIEDMIGAGMTAGALGGKLVGAGMGGSIVMLAPGKQTEVAKALTAAGGEGFPVEIDVGARIDEN